MAEYIDRKALLKTLQEELDFESPMFTPEQNRWIVYGLKCAVKDVKYHPAADVAEVKHGHWVMNSDRPDAIICSECNVSFDAWKHEQKDCHFCPNCGAKMDGINERNVT